MRKCSRGATLIETALSIGLFFVFLFFIIDLARYFFLYAVLNYSAFLAADFASKNEIEIAGDYAYCANQAANNPTNNRCDRYETLINEMHTLARDTAHLVATDADAPSSMTLVDMEQYRQANYPNCGLSYCSQADGYKTSGCLLRPGEVCIRPAQNNLAIEEIDHPTRPPIPANVQTPGAEVTANWPNQNENWGGILQNNPFVYRMEAIFKPITPFAPSFVMVAEQAGFRYAGTFGFAGALAPGTPVGGNSTPTDVPTDTPTNAPFVPTDTPTDTPTPTPTAGCWCCFASDGSPQVNALYCTLSFCAASCWPTPTPRPTRTPTATATFTPTACLACTPTPTKTPTRTYTPTVTPTQTSTKCPPSICTVTPTRTPTPTISPTPTKKPTATPTVTPTAIPSPTPTDTPVATPTPNSCPPDCVSCHLTYGCNCSSCVNG